MWVEVCEHCIYTHTKQNLKETLLSYFVCRLSLMKVWDTFASRTHTLIRFTLIFTYLCTLSYLSPGNNYHRKPRLYKSVQLCVIVYRNPFVSQQYSKQFYLPSLKRLEFWEDMANPERKGWLLKGRLNRPANYTHIGVQLVLLLLVGDQYFSLRGRSTSGPSHSPPHHHTSGRVSCCVSDV